MEVIVFCFFGLVSNLEVFRVIEGVIALVSSIKSIVTSIVKSCWLAFGMVVNIVGFISLIKNNKSGIIESS